MRCAVTGSAASHRAEIERFVALRGPMGARLTRSGLARQTSARCLVVVRGINAPRRSGKPGSRRYFLFGFCRGTYRPLSARTCRSRP
jgi:hypothetical protein